jgi:DNA-binding NarL/FixJ family response regulator
MMLATGSALSVAQASRSPTSRGAGSTKGTRMSQCRLAAQLVAEVRSVQEALDALAQTIMSSAEAPCGCQRPLPATTVAPAAHLTDREIDVLTLIGRGCANRGIAAQLGISEKTVKTHLSKVFGKLGVSTRSQAVLAVERLGLLETDATVPVCPAQRVEC